jgi:hypothetical protein
MPTPFVRNLVLILLACLLSFLAGKDINWDLINYHLYLPHAWTFDTLHTDFMGAGPNSYFNPIGYLPFYWMVKADWHSLVIGSTLATIHGLNLVLLWEISERVVSSSHPQKKVLAAFSALLGVGTPVFLGTVGGTFLEPTLTVLVLGAVLLLAVSLDASAQERKAQFQVLAAGLLLGLATGFKLTNIVFAAAAGISLLFFVVTRRVTPGRVFVFGAALLTGYLIANGWWAYQLYREFGNPFFPFFNEIFQSPDFSTAKLDHDRFKPVGLKDVVSLPFRMAEFHSWIYVENNAPDLRPAVLTIFGVVLLSLRFFRFVSKHQTCPSDERAPSQFLWGFFFLSICAWLWTTGNGRYGFPILLLTGPMLVVLVSQTVRATKPVVIILTTVALAQAFHVWNAGNPRWSAASWTSQWFAAAIPKKLAEQPFAYVSLGVHESNSIVAPFLPLGSTFLSLTGATYAFRPDGPGSRRIRQYLDSQPEKLRSLVKFNPEASEILPSHIDAWNQSLAPWNLVTNASDCVLMDIDLGEAKYDGSPLPSAAKSKPIRLVSCAIGQGPGEDAETRETRARLTKVFDTIESHCPLLFSPRGWHLTKRLRSWHRVYLQSDIVVTVRGDRLSLSKYDFGPFDVDMGSIVDWEQGTANFQCKRLDKPW